jgi:SAM-dependent methyltransferase
MAIDADGGHATWHALYSLICEQRGRRADAIEALQRAIALSGGDGPSHFRLARLLAAEGLRKDAIAAAQKAVSTTPRWEWFALLSTLERQQGNWPAALAASEAVLKYTDAPTVKMRAAVADLKARIARGGDSAEATPEYYDRIYRESEPAQLDSEASIYAQVWAKIADAIAEAGVRRVLDLGCGPGQFAEFLSARVPDVDYRGIDISGPAIERARARCPAARFEQADALRSDLVTTFDYDVVVCTEMLEHVADDLGVLARLRPGTLFIGSVPDFDSFGHVRYFGSAEEVRQRYGSSFGSLDVEEIRLSPTARLFYLSGTTLDGGKGRNVRKTEQEYIRFKAERPDSTFTRFFWERELAKVRRGESHASLGSSLSRAPSWARGGEALFGAYRDILGLTSTARVMDYGCGSLRLGFHLIRFLDPHCYFGLDLLEELIEIGKQLAGRPLLELKAPVLAVLNERTLAQGRNFDAEFVISTAVAYHIPPEETASFFANLAMLAHARGARVMFDAKLASKPLRYTDSGWAWPLRFYQEAMAPLQFVGTHREGEYSFDPRCRTALLEFRRA